MSTRQRQTNLLALPLTMVLSLMACPMLCAQNLLVNPRFQEDISGWVVGQWVSCAWDPLDADGSVDSGSGRVFFLDHEHPGVGTGISQKLAVTPGDVFDIEVTVRFAPDQESSVEARIFVFWYETTQGCTGQYLEHRGYSEEASVPPLESWQTLNLRRVAAPSGSTCGTFAFNLRNSLGPPPAEAYFDNASVVQVPPEIFADAFETGDTRQWSAAVN